MKTHLAVTFTRDSDTMITTTLCGRMSGQAVDGINSEEQANQVTCRICQQILATPKHWRHRKYITPTGNR